jgi:hypothetical protein
MSKIVAYGKVDWIMFSVMIYERVDVLCLKFLYLYIYQCALLDQYIYYFCGWTYSLFHSLISIDTHISDQCTLFYLTLLSLHLHNWSIIDYRRWYLCTCILKHEIGICLYCFYQCTPYDWKNILLSFCLTCSSFVLSTYSYFSQKYFMLVMHK